MSRFRILVSILALSLLPILAGCSPEQNAKKREEATNAVIQQQKKAQAERFLKDKPKPGEVRPPGSPP